MGILTCFCHQKHFSESVTPGGEKKISIFPFKKSLNDCGGMVKYILSGFLQRIGGWVLIEWLFPLTDGYVYDCLIIKISGNGTFVFPNLILSV